MSKELAGKVAIVTGAGRLRGIGRASAVRLAEMGAALLVATLDRLAAGDTAQAAQDDALATYAAKIEKAEARIDWAYRY